MPYFARRRESARVVALREHLARPLPQCVQSPRNHDAQAPHAAREAACIARLADVVQVVRLHGEVHDPKAIALAGLGDCTAHDLEFGPLAQASQASAQALRHEQRVSRRSRRACGVRGSRDRTFRLASRAGPRAAMLREGELTLLGFILALLSCLLHAVLHSHDFEVAQFDDRDDAEREHAVSYDSWLSRLQRRGRLERTPRNCLARVRFRGSRAANALRTIPCHSIVQTFGEAVGGSNCQEFSKNQPDCDSSWLLAPIVRDYDLLRSSSAQRCSERRSSPASLHIRSSMIQLTFSRRSPATPTRFADLALDEALGGGPRRQHSRIRPIMIRPSSTRASFAILRGSGSRALVDDPRSGPRRETCTSGRSRFGQIVRTVRPQL
jgi:hypothetical protein